MISLAQARAVIAAGEAHALATGVAVSLVVMDEGAHLKAFGRMESAARGSIDLAFGKARTAVLFEMRSEALWEFGQPGGAAPGIERSNGGLVVFGGGIPLRNSNGKVIGAVGVSGGTVAQDGEIAEAAVAAFEG